MKTKAPASAVRTPQETPWQLTMFRRSLKKQQKLALLLAQIGETAGKSCLLVTHGDNNGALNYFFRQHGGDWTWVEHAADNIHEMELLLAEKVLVAEPSRLPVDDGAFDVVVAIDVHEHLEDSAAFNRELARVVGAGGTVVVTTPNGDRWKPVTALKQLLGMTKETYGHRVLGYNVEQHRRMLAEAGLVPVASGSYSKFFTELLELALNFAYLTVLSRKSGAGARPGTIAPSSSRELRAVGREYRFYSAVYPLLWAISRLDLALFFLTGYAVSVVARRPP